VDSVVAYFMVFHRNSPMRTEESQGRYLNLVPPEYVRRVTAEINCSGACSLLVPIYAS
jgi:hypothetical protein